MSTRLKPADLLVNATLVLVLLAALAAVLWLPAAAAAASSPAPAEDKPFVNWGWLAAGLGGMIALLVIMFLLTRFFGNRKREE